MLVQLRVDVFVSCWLGSEFEDWMAMLSCDGR